MSTKTEFVTIDELIEAVRNALFGCPRRPPACVGDCDRNGRITADELITGVNVLLRKVGIGGCPDLDGDQDGTGSVHELVLGLINAINGCPGGASNAPPLVDAGPDVTIMLPTDTVALAGVASDDGLPRGKVLTTAWIRVSGPGDVLFDDPASPATTARFSAAGIYVLRLTAHDGELSASDEVTVTVLPALLNQAPVITSLPPAEGTAGAVYRYAVEAADPDAGDTLTFSLPIAPAGMSIDPATGVIEWTPAGTQTGHNNVAVRVQDSRGLFAAQGFGIQVGVGAANAAPVARDDAYEARFGETLGVAAPGVLENDGDPDGNTLAARLVTRPRNGTVRLNADGSFTYTPYTFRAGEVIATEIVDLPLTVPGTTVRASSFGGSSLAPDVQGAIDGSLGSSWLTRFIDNVALGTDAPSGGPPFIEVTFPHDVNVTELAVFGHRNPLLANFKIFAGFFQLFDATGAEIFNSGVVDLPAPERDGQVVVPDLFERATNLARTTPGAVYRASQSGDGSFCAGNPAALAFDGDLFTGWGTPCNTPTPQFIEVEFPADVTVHRIRTFGDRRRVSPDRNFTRIVVQAFDAEGDMLFDSGTLVVATNRFEMPDTTVEVGGIAGIRRVRVTGTEQQGPQAAIAEVEVIGIETVSTALNDKVRRARFTDTADGGSSVGLAEFRIRGLATVERPEGAVEGNLAQLLPVAVNASSADGFNIPENVVDDSTMNWYSTGTGTDFIELVLPSDVTVNRLQILNPNATPQGFGTSLGIRCFGTFELFGDGGERLFDSGLVNAPTGGISATGVFNLDVPNVSGVRRARYTVDSCPGSSVAAGFSEFRVFGSAAPTPPPPALRVVKAYQALTGRKNNATPLVVNLTDDNGDGRIDRNDIPDIVVPVQMLNDQLRGEIKVVSGDDGRELFTLGSSRISPWAELAAGDLDGDGVAEIVAIAANGQNLLAFDFGGGEVQGDLVQHLPVTIAADTFVSPPHLAVDGDESTAWVGADGFFEITFPQDVTVNELRIVAVPRSRCCLFDTGRFELSAADGTVLFDSDTVAMPAAGTEMVLAVSNVSGVRQMRFTSTERFGGVAEFKVIGSAVVPQGQPKRKWISDPNPMLDYFIDASRLIVGTVALANLDGGPRAHIVVGASVWDADGELLGDGRTLGGTTAGTGMRSAAPAIADLDLDGIPEIVAGPTAYRLVKGGLEIVWRRADRPDGFVGIGNFDDDPYPEIVIVTGNGRMYMLNHDGTDAEGWNPPSHAPIVLPGDPAGAGGPGQAGPPLVADVDGDGIPEIGVVRYANYLLYDRDGSLRWRQGIRDNSFSSGSTAFDFDGDGLVELVHRDEQFLRIWRGTDGLLLVKNPVGSATWVELPVVADVDNDGHADIVVTADGADLIDTGVHVFRDVANTWRPTRRIWNQHGYHITNVNEDGTIPRVETPNWLVAGLNNFRTNAFIPGESADAADSFTYVAGDGALESERARVRITVRAPNSPPQITSAPVTTAATGVLYTYPVQASDPDPGDILTFALAAAPAGMTIEPSSGVIRWTPAADQLGVHEVVVKVRDLRSAFAMQNYSVEVSSPLGCRTSWERRGRRPRRASSPPALRWEASGLSPAQRRLPARSSARTRPAGRSPRRAPPSIWSCRLARRLRGACRTSSGSFNSMPKPTSWPPASRWEQ